MSKSTNGSDSLKREKDAQKREKDAPEQTADTEKNKLDQPEPISLDLIQGVLDSLLLLTDDIDILNKKEQQIEGIRSSLDAEIQRISELIRPQKQFDDERLLGHKKRKLKPYEKEFERMRLEALKNKMTSVKQIQKNIRAKIKKLATDRSQDLKIEGLRIKSQSESYMQKNLPFLKQRIEKVFRIVGQTDEGLAKIYELQTLIRSGNEDEFLKLLFDILKDANKEVHTLASGLKKTKDHLSTEIGVELKELGQQATSVSNNRFFPKSVSDALQSLSKPQTTPVNKKPVLRKAKPGK